MEPNQPPPNPENANQVVNDPDSDGWEDAAEVGEDEMEENNFETNPNAPLKTSSDKDVFRCKHYQRACHLRCPSPICKDKFWPCRLCHDEVCYEQ